MSSADYHVRCAVANAIEGMSLSGRALDDAMKALALARESPLGIADRSTVERVMDRLKPPMEADSRGC